MKNKEIVIEFVNYTKKFRNEVVLDNINITFEKGGFYGIIGKNGSGKSVLFKAICGFIKPTNGFVKVNGKKIGVDEDFPKNVGAMIEKPGFLQSYTGYKNLKFLSEINNVITDKEIHDIMKLVELNPISEKIVKDYSLGMKQRLGIAQAIMENPDIIILDEPMNGLDSAGVKLVREVLKLLHSKGKTLIISSHNDEDIKELCNLVYRVEDNTVTLT